MALWRKVGCLYLNDIRKFLKKKKNNQYTHFIGQSSNETLCKMWLYSAFIYELNTQNTHETPVSYYIIKFVLLALFLLLQIYIFFLFII